MRKSNLITTLFFCVVIVCTLIFMAYSKHSDKISNEKTISTTEKINKKKTQQKKDSKSEKTKEQANTVKKGNDKKTDTSFSMDNSLFIGDSRTVGLMEYSQMKDVDFFCTVGMSVFNIYDDAISVSNIGKVTLSELLDSKKYDRIYIMLGVNEMGYKFEKILEKYKELIQFIKEKEPDTTIFLQANLHVTSERSDYDDTFNNKSINRLNTALSKLANQKDIFYIDVNPLFDDENGDLSADKSSDNTHLYAKYYKEWGQWIIEQTSLLTD